MINIDKTNLKLYLLREEFCKIAEALARKNNKDSSEVYDWAIKYIEKKLSVNITSRTGINLINKLNVKELEFIIKTLYPKYIEYINSVDLDSGKNRVKIVKSDLLTLYEEVFNYKLPFYAKQDDWEHAYVRVDEFVNEIAVGVYFNHNQYKNRKKDFIYRSKNLCWKPITNI